MKINASCLGHLYKLGIGFTLVATVLLVGAQVGRASGVGPKLAQRILVELKGKPIGAAGFSAAGVSSPPPAGPARVSAAGEAVAALMGLGVAEMQARRLVDQAAAALGPEAAVSDLVRAGLKEMGR